ncbi:MAG: helix-turn-helix transcriptional regulator [Bacteroidales bacterium]|nr:helix-turn-helix transcriptional regulator [Bacteroidales bacterium]MBR6298177.1 helix-turn-helix transcriptional regulator [Candidatus Gastranaerophilales bacterium]MBR7035561.1 helix-turn-helix transcriptional regulator [Bacteroidales bacterium]
MNDEYAINDRIAHLISEYGLTNADFAKKLGVPASSISHLIAKRNKPGLNFIMSLLEQYKDIDANWLLTGVRSSRAMARSQQEDVVEPDLFTTVEPESSSVSVEKREQLQKNDVFSPQKDVQPKKVEKIVTFYTDKTFTEYFPE